MTGSIFPLITLEEQANQSTQLSLNKSLNKFMPMKMLQKKHQLNYIVNIVIFS